MYDEETQEGGTITDIKLQMAFRGFPGNNIEPERFDCRRPESEFKSQFSHL